MRILPLYKIVQKEGLILRKAGIFRLDHERLKFFSREIEDFFSLKILVNFTRQKKAEVKDEKKD